MGKLRSVVKPSKTLAKEMFACKCAQQIKLAVHLPKLFTQGSVSCAMKFNGISPAFFWSLSSAQMLHSKHTNARTHTHTINNSHHWALTKWQHRHCCADDRAKLMTVWWIHLIFSRPRCCRRIIFHPPVTHQNEQFVHTQNVYTLYMSSGNIIGYLVAKWFWLVGLLHPTKEAKITHRPSRTAAKCHSRRRYCCSWCRIKTWLHHQMLCAKVWMHRPSNANMIIIFIQLKLYLKCYVFIRLGPLAPFTKYFHVSLPLRFE